MSHVLALRFQLKNARGDVLDQSGSEPLAVLLGAGQVVPGLERALTERVDGSRGGRADAKPFDVVVAPADGFGERAPDTDSTLEAPRALFPEGFELAPGAAIALEDEDGAPVPVWIRTVSDDHVVLDTNHPLAGESLHFTVEIVGMRAATSAEKRAGQALGGVA
jgi:FKBP-type peptidyl-prolyl cis-trans isomerase SlyD